MREETAALRQTITELSHEFGTPDYVKGGGGNTSCKTADTLWIKPSGTTLRGLTPQAFVALDRARLDRLYAVAPPADPAAREALVKRMMEQAVRPEHPGRASVEGPLHNTFSAVFVVHVHPPLINGLTCARGGRSAAERLYPEALWVPYVDPGYALCMKVRGLLQDYRRRHGREPALVLLENHGLFVAADTAAEVRRLFAAVMSRAAAAYAAAGVATALRAGAPAAAAERERTAQSIRRWLGAEAAAVRYGGVFEPADGPLTPDHLLYARAFPLRGEPTEQSAAAYRAAHGYAPRVIAAPAGVFGAGPSENIAALALEMAEDGALVRQLADAFGGVQYLTPAARAFIENWEAETYRQQQIQ